ncbi:uncharacterized protein BCR38DRAFT_454323 [Pseudomassariella vexata]|uniref:Uncharacterized protein n=1 Tax=Pseudomassariella vexata TaxID=1141098 RepID=A0A1Y2EK43_9PEZI|nr:uncharacterized protein BCR38DRAFT_454323 [Pseudomassariella vexata]ORY71932.1 hypothetical protein BCR38DRAFT_454323 [Pseudomassariella vexata]
MSREQKFALVTGCGKGGIGEALVKDYTRQGVRVIAIVLPKEPSEHLDEAGITWFTLDVTNEEYVIHLKRKISALTDGSLDFRKCVGQGMFDVNLFGPMQMVHHFHGMIIQASGTIVNIGSIGGIVPYIYGSSYNASKAALHHWSNTLCVEMSPFKLTLAIAVAHQNHTKVIPGEVGTNILKNDVHRELPQELLRSALFLMPQVNLTVAWECRDSPRPRSLSSRLTMTEARTFKA